MSQSTVQFRELLGLALAGDQEALGELLEAHRGYLRLLAEREIGGRLRARVDGSDIVQQTYVSACRNFGEFQGTKPAEFAVWLRRIHERNIQDAVRDNVQIAKRAVGREERIGDGAGAPLLSGRRSSPSQRAMRGEQVIELADAMEQLAADQRETVRLRYLEGASIAEIANALDRTPAAVAGLLARGLVKLRRRIGKSE